MSAGACCVLAGHNLEAGTGAETVWTSAAPMQLRDASGGGGKVDQDRG